MARTRYPGLCLCGLACVLVAACGDGASGSKADAEIVADVAEVAVGDELDATGVDRDTLIRPEVETSEIVVPLEAPTGVWTWFDQPGSACSDGSETGFAVNRGTGDELLFVFMGGGACWDFNTCFVFETAAKGPIGKKEFDAVARAIGVGVLDRADADNPYRTWTQVFVPYCTGDLHAGERVASYTAGGLTRAWHHMGALNVRLMRARVAATFPAPSRLVVAGLSAGGFGATLQYAGLRDALGAGESQLVDDSGPLLVGGAIPGEFRSAWFKNWRLDQVVDPICGQDCKADLAVFYAKLAARYPEDRMALISSLRDEVISAYFTMLPPLFEVELRKLATEVLAPLPNWRTFLVSGSTHTTLGEPGAFGAGGVELRAWLGAMLAGEASWVNVAP